MKRIARKGFDLDLKDGEVKEEQLKQILACKIEVKFDEMSATTGNFFCEYECSNKPSGIVTTEAEYYDVSLPNQVHILIPTFALRHLINTNKFRSVSGGDNYAAKGYLIPLSELIAYENV